MPSGTLPLDPPPRRSCLGCLTTGGLGCGSFLLGAAAAVVLFAPRLLGGLAAGLVESELSARIAGRIEVSRLELSWEQAQHASGVRLFDPDGELVLEGELVLPSLLDLGDPDVFKRVELVLSRAALVQDEQGRSNLQRALEPNPDHRPGQGQVTFRIDDPEAWSRPFPFQLRVRQVGENLLYRDARRPGSLVRLRELELDLVRDEVGGLEFRGRTGLRTGEGEGRLDWSVLEQAAVGGRSARRAGTVEGQDLPAVWLDALLGARGVLQQSLREPVRLALSWEGDPGGDVPLDGRLEAGAAGTLTLQALLRGDHLLATGDGLSGTLLPPSEAVASLVQELLPAGLTVQREAGRPWRVEAQAFDLALADLPASGDGRCQVRFVPPPDDGRLVDEDGADWLLLQDVVWSLQLDDLGTRWSVRGQLRLPEEGSAPAPFEVHVGPDARAADALRLHCSGFPTRAADRLQRTGGALARSLGERLELDLVRPRGPGVARVTLDGGTGRRLELEALEEHLQLDGGSALMLELPWSAELEEHLLRPLLPFLRFDGWTPADRLGVRIEQLVLPRDGDLARVRARLGLDPRSVPVRLAPGLAEEFGMGADGQAMAGGRLLPVRLDVDAGRVVYHELVLPLGQEELELEGSLDLLRDELALSGAAPVHRLRSKLPILEGVAPEALAAAGLEVDVELRGDPADPRLLVDSRELGSMLVEVLRWVEQGRELLGGGDDEGEAGRDAGSGDGESGDGGR